LGETDENVPTAPADWTGIQYNGFTERQPGAGNGELKTIRRTALLL